MASSLVDIFITVMFTIIGGGAVGFVLYLSWFYTRFKHNFRLRELTGTRKLIFDDKAREIVSDGTKMWELLRKRRKVPVPPDEAIDISKRGVKCVEAYLTQTDDIVYIKDVADDKSMLETANFKPMTTKQKHIYMAEMKKAYERSRKKWQDMVLPIAGIAGLVIMVVALMVFYEDMGKPLLQMGERLDSIAGKFENIAEYQYQLDKEVQIIKNQQQNPGGGP